MADLHAVPPPTEPEQHNGWTPERYRNYWKTIMALFAVAVVFALLDVLPVIGFLLITLLLLGLATAATVLRARQLNRDRKEWSS